MANIDLKYPVVPGEGCRLPRKNEGTPERILLGLAVKVTLAQIRNNDDQIDRCIVCTLRGYQIQSL